IVAPTKQANCRKLRCDPRMFGAGTARSTCHDRGPQGKGGRMSVSGTAASVDLTGRSDARLVALVRAGGARSAAPQAAPGGTGRSLPSVTVTLPRPAEPVAADRMVKPPVAQPKLQQRLGVLSTVEQAPHG